MPKQDDRVAYPPRCPRRASAAARRRRSRMRAWLVEPLRATSPRRLRSRRSGHATRSARRRLAPFGCHATTLPRAPPRFARMPSRSSLEGVVELLDAFGLEHFDDVVVVDAGLAQLLCDQVPLPRSMPSERPCRPVPRRDPGSASHRLGRHRVHRVRPDQVLDVHHVAVGGILGGGRRPERLLLRRAPCCGEVLPARAAERVRENARTRASRSRSASFPCSFLLPTGFSRRLSASVSTRDTKNDATELTLLTDRLRLRRRRSSPRMYASATARVALEREDQRDVDRLALRDAILDRRRGPASSPDILTARFSRSTSLAAARSPGRTFRSVS